MSNDFGISFDDILKEIERLSQVNIEGFTSQEMSLALNKKPRWCREKIRELIAAGKIVYNGGRKTGTIDNKFSYVPVYRLVKK